MCPQRRQQVNVRKKHKIKNKNEEWRTHKNKYQHCSFNLITKGHHPPHWRTPHDAVCWLLSSIHDFILFILYFYFSSLHVKTLMAQWTNIYIAYIYIEKAGQLLEVTKCSQQSVISNTLQTSSKWIACSFFFFLFFGWCVCCCCVQGRTREAERASVVAEAV